MKRLEQMREQLISMAEAEALKLWRIARKAEEHGCSVELVCSMRREANWLHNEGTAYPDRLLDWKFKYEFKYAFKM